MATLINWLDDALKKKFGSQDQTKAMNAPLKQGNNSIASLKSTAIPNQPRSRGPVAPQNLDIRDRNYGGRSTPQVRTLGAANDKAQVTKPNLNTINSQATPQFGGQQKALNLKTANNKQNESWFNQVEDSNKLRQYYDEEFKKNNDRAGIFGRMFDGGQVAATAKTEALNRYNQDLLRRAYDDNGKVVDTKAYSELKGKTADLATNAAAQSHQVAQAQTNRMGANDLEQGLGKRFLHTMEAINGMDMASGVVGVNDPEKFGIDDIGRFALNLPAGIVTSPITGARNAGRAISGRGLNAETGEMQDLSDLQRLGAGLSAGIDLVSPFIGGSGTLLKSIATSGSKQVAKQAGKQAVKSGAKEFAKRLVKEAVEEAGEEAFQNLAEELNEQGKWDEGTLGRTAEAAALGALGSGLMTGAGTAIGAGKAKLNQQGGLRGLIGEAKNTVDSGMKNVGNTIDNIMAGNNQKLAYAGGAEPTNQNIVNNKNNSIRTDMTIVKGAAPDGGDLVISDFPIKRDIPQNEAAKAGRESLKKLVGKIVPVGDSKMNATFNKKYRGELTRRNDDMSGNQYRAKLDLLGNADELFDTARNVKSEPNRKTISKPDIKEYYTGTSYGKDGTGKIYEMNVKSQVKKDGSNNPYAITNLNETPGRSFLKSGDQTQNAQAPLSDTSVSQNTNNVNTKNTFDMGRHTESISNSNIAQNEIDSYYKKYGSDFYDKMPDNLRTQYDAMLDNAPRDAKGRYTDPITGEKWIDEVIEGGAPDGSNLVKTDYNLPKDTPINKIGQAIRDVIGKRFQGKTYKVGSTDTEANITARTRSEMGYQQKNMSDNDFVKKGSMVGNLDELIENMQGVRKVANHKADKKPNVDHYISGRVAVDLGDGKTYYPRVDIEVSKNGNAIGYNIADIREFPRLKPQGSPLSATNSLVDDTGTHSRTMSIAQEDNNVNTKSELGSLYKKYDSDFYDKMPDDLRTRYEKLLDAQPRAKDGTYTDPITGEKWIDEAAKSEIDTKAYVKSQVAAQKAENKTPIKQKIQDSIDNLKHYLVDDAVAYERYVKDKGDRLNLREGVDRVRTSDTIAKQMIDDSGLSEAIGKMSTRDADEFQQYLIAKRSQELKRTKGADFKTGRNDAADQALIKSVGNKYAEQEKVVREFNKQMLNYAADSGLISEKLRDQLIRDNTDYVPMNRVLDDITDMGMHKSKQIGNLGKQTAVQKIEGSDRIVQNPLESMIRNAIRTVNEGERNKVAKALSETAAFREARLPEGSKPKFGNDTLSFIVNGEKVSYEVPALVAKEMKGLNGVMPDFAQNVLKVLGAPTKVLRTGATGANPMFAISNLVRDQLQTTITGNLKANIKGTPKALKATFGIGAEGKAMQAELARNGIIGSEYRQTYGYKSGELVKELQQSHQLSKQAVEKLKHPIDTIADVIGKTEYFTRAQQYFGTDGTVTEKSQAARNNTLNFGRAGSTVRVLNKVIPFLNAGVQGGRITVNQFKERPVRTTMAVAAFAGVAAAVRGVNSAQNQELWDRIGDEEKQSNLIIFGKDAHYDPETNRVVGVTKIPLPQMVYPITDAINNLKGESEDLMMLGGDIFTAMTGIDANNPVNQLLPTAIKPFVETAMNKNTYTGQELVSDYDSNLNPEDKGKKYTTGVARSVAKATGIDAPIIDNFIQNWGGGLFKDLTKVMTDNPDNKSDGGGIGEIFSQGAFRRFMSASVESQYDIQATLAENYKKRLKADPAFQALDANEQKKALDRIDTDTKAIAGYAAKTEQGRSSEITSDLSKRQKSLMQNGFDVSNYNKPAKSTGGHNIEISDSLGNEHKDMLDKYNSMEKEDWNQYIYSVEGREAEYKLAVAKLENDKANGELTEVQQLKREKELRKLKVSQTWDKSVRDAYSLAGSKADMQGLLGELENRNDMVGYLNALNRAMYDAGVITASTYKSRNRNINNLDSKTAKGKSKSKTAYSAASKAALSAYTKALAGGNSIKVNRSTSAPSTSRKMSATTLATSIKKSTLGAKARVSVKKGIK